MNERVDEVIPGLNRQREQNVQVYGVVLFSVMAVAEVILFAAAVIMLF